MYFQSQEMTSQHKSSLEGLPKQLVSSMRTLFDLMDDKRTGFVKLTDIEKWWQEGNSRGLPSGVVDCLRKVTASNGLLTFERFCAGLQICLLRSRHEPSRTSRLAHGQSKMRPATSRPASVPLPGSDSGNVRKQIPLGKILSSTGSTERLSHNIVSPPPSRLGRYNTATVPPNNVRFAQQRALSMPQLQTGAKYPVHKDQLTSDLHPNKHDLRRPPPPVPMSRAMVTMALEKWRMMKSYHPPHVHMPQVDTKVPQPLRENFLKRESVSYPNLPTESLAAGEATDSGPSLRIQERGPAAKKANRKREPRRHTVSSGVDYNMIKRLKLLEQEKDYLLQGLDVVERARNWYMQQITAVSDKLEQISKWDTPHSDYSMDAHRERLNFQMTRIFEVNQHLNALMETSEKGFPIHMNLAVHQRNIYEKQKNASQTIQRLKEQNHSLTEEIGKKSEIITQLETEKSDLIRELFKTRSQHQKDSNDTTLW